MSVDGIWKLEMLGPYGWEPVSAAFLDNGTYRAASASHYAVGRYETSGNRIEVKTRGVQFGETRTVFGKKDKVLDLVLEGEIDGDVITGRASDGSNAYEISVRLTRLEETA